MGRQRSNAERVRGYLAKHDVKCPGCGYDLKGLQGIQCSECGRILLIEDLLPPKPFTGQWLALRVCVWTLWAACAGTITLYLIETIAVIERVTSRASGAPVLLLIGALVLLRRGREAYNENRWPEFRR